MYCSSASIIERMVNHTLRVKSVGVIIFSLSCSGAGRGCLLESILSASRAEFVNVEIGFQRNPGQIRVVARRPWERAAWPGEACQNPPAY
jgi:hypothetical protein